MEEESEIEVGPAVVYRGRSNLRSLTRRDLSGDPEASATDVLAWTPGAAVGWESWLDFAGSAERAHQVLSQHQHEFELVGEVDGVDVAGEEEFSIGGTVAD